MKQLTAVTALLILAGCAAMDKPSPEQIENADYGTYPSDYERIVKQYIRRMFLEPDSVQDLSIQPPQKYWITNSAIMGGRTTYGYMVQFSCNARSRAGNYIGVRTTRLFIRNGVVVRQTDPDHQGVWH